MLANAGPARITEDAQRWIAENLLIGVAPQLIVGRLLERGCPLALAKAEVDLAASSPYVQGAAVLKARLAKRDWLLASYSKLARGEGSAVEVVRDLSSNAFFRDYYAAHRPVLLEGLIDHWPAMRRWSLDYFEEALGDAEIEVQTRRESNAAYEQDSVRHKTLMPLSQVLTMLRAPGETNDFYVTANNGGHNRAALAALWDDVGPIPAYLDPASDQDGFFWMGPKGTVTPFHHDLTNNLLLQISGRKRVTLVPSWDTPLMRNTNHCYTSFTGPEELAALPEAERPAMIECVIEPGQALFIPVGWWHHVVGLDVTIGMSFTNFTRDNDFYSGYTTYGQV